MGTSEIVLICFVVVLVVSLFLACLYRYTRKIFKTYLPTKVTDFDILDAYAKEVETVLLGDSLTDFFPIHEFAPNLRLSNRGVASETTAQVEARLDRILALSPKYVYLQIGVNDLIKERARKLSPTRLVERIMRIVAQLRAQEIAVSVLSLYPVNPHRTRRSRMCLKHVTNARIYAVNQLLELACEKNDIPYIDIAQNLVDDKSNLAIAYTIEGLHLTVLGYERIFQVLQPIFEKNN